MRRGRGWSPPKAIYEQRDWCSYLPPKTGACPWTIASFLPLGSIPGAVSCLDTENYVGKEKTDLCKRNFLANPTAWWLLGGNWGGTEPRCRPQHTLRSQQRQEAMKRVWACSRQCSNQRKPASVSLVSIPSRVERLLQSHRRQRTYQRLPGHRCQQRGPERQQSATNWVAAGRR